MTVSQIFGEFGEEGFRDMEHKACAELAAQHNLVIAAGGGALTFERNVNVFKGKDIIVLLDVSLDVIQQRLEGDKNRPLLQRPDRDEAMKSLYYGRMPKYLAAADIVVKGEGTPIKTAFAVMEAVKGMTKTVSRKPQKQTRPY